MTKTSHTLARLAAVLMIAAAPGAALAQTTIGNPAAIGGNNCRLAYSTGGTGQTFVVPAGVYSVRSVSIAGGWGDSDIARFRIGLRESVGGPELFGANVSSASHYSSASATEILTIPGHGYPVTPGQTLFISIDDLDPSIDLAVCYGTNYIDGSLYIRGSEMAGDTAFSVVFNDTPPPAPVPTLSEWAMILFGAILVGGASLYIQRRRQFGQA